MRIVYCALNKNRPKFLGEIIMNTLEFENAPAPYLIDVKHLTNVLSSDP